MKTPSLSHVLLVSWNAAGHLKQFKPLKENLKGARRAPCLSTMTPPPVVESVSFDVRYAAGV